MKTGLRVLHTSDWHLGRSLYGRQRYDEFEQFLHWLVATIVAEQVDVVLVAGDIFDTSTPSNRSQELYYQFLQQIISTAQIQSQSSSSSSSSQLRSRCRHVIITGGNHDSPTFLNAPKDLLRGLNIHIIGSATEDISREVITLYASDGTPEGVVCAVPYLRDRDIRTVEAFESIDSKVSKVVAGLKSHYDKVCSVGEEHRDELYARNASASTPATASTSASTPTPTSTSTSTSAFPTASTPASTTASASTPASTSMAIPIIVMGHLFAAGGKTVDGDGVRELYASAAAHVGGLIRIRGEDFPPSADYVALGHLHAPQVVGGMDHIRYCGSPLPMGFSEANQTKVVVVVEFGTAEAGSEGVGSLPVVREVAVPCFQRLERIVGNMDIVLGRIRQMKGEGSSAWLEIEYTGEDAIASHSATLREVIDDALEGSAMEVRRIKNNRFRARAMGKSDAEGVAALDDLNRADVFEMCLDAHEIPVESRLELVEMFDEIVRALDEADRNAD